MANNESQFIERRKEYRLPYNGKVIFSDGEISSTAYASNISRGGVFANTLDPLPIDTKVSVAICLNDHPVSLCFKAKVAHIVFDRQRCEVECGVGFQFLELNEQQKSILNLHILNQQSAYLDLKRVIAEKRPDPGQIRLYLAKLPTIQTSDLMSLRYRVNRICTIFEPSESLDSSLSGRKTG